VRAVRAVAGAPRIVEIDDPVADDGRVVIDVVSSSICGTDFGLVAMGSEGYTLGHEFAGTVDGILYAVEPSVYCGACEECLAGHTQRCTGEHANLGVFSDGGLADRARVPAYSLAALPDGLPLADACLVEPASVSWHGVRRAQIQPGERVVVVGGGSIGLLAVAAARSLGHDVALEARHPHQHDAGRRLGATAPSGEYDVVIEAAGSESGLARCAELAAPGGRIVLLGVYHSLVPVPGIPTIVKELSWLAAMAYERHDGTREFDEAAALLATNPDIAATLITHRFPLDDAAEAFRVAEDRASGAIKVVLQP
jgi:2-desacetyl-2-hydroxyethyl bacteriochlorophyllide A dehydrogenase